MIQRKSTKLLLVDDDPSLLKLLGMRLMSEGFNVITAENGNKALTMLANEAVDLVISDLYMDEMDGMTLFEAIQNQYPGLPVIILTAHGSAVDAEAAIRKGVASFLTKPVDRDALYQAIDDALEHRIVQSQYEWPYKAYTQDPYVMALYAKAREQAMSDHPILIIGPMSTGKAMLGRAIYALSVYQEHPLFELRAEQFDQEDDVWDRLNRYVTQSTVGTLLLIDLDKLSSTAQANIVTFLQTHNHTKRLRLIATSQYPLNALVNTDNFNKTLSELFTQAPLRLPALSERSDDIPLFARYFLETFSKQNESLARDFEPQALAALSHARWPANIEQLRRVVQRCALTSQPIIDHQTVVEAMVYCGADLLPFAQAQAEFEQQYLHTLITTAHHDLNYAMQVAQCDRESFDRLLKRNGYTQKNRQIVCNNQTESTSSMPSNKNRVIE